MTTLDETVRCELAELTTGQVYAARDAALDALYGAHHNAQYTYSDEQIAELHERIRTVNAIYQRRI